MVCGAVAMQAQIVDLEFDPFTQHRIPVHPARTLTLQFPQPIDGLDGLGFVFDPATQAGEFLVNHSQGTRFLSIVPLSGNPPPRNLNVIVDGAVIVIAPVMVARAEEAYSVVRFVDPALEAEKELARQMKESQQKERLAKIKEVMERQGSEKGQWQGRISRDGPAQNNSSRSGDVFGGRSGGSLEVKRLDSPPPKGKPVSSSQMLGVLDTTKLLAGLDEDRLAATVRAMPHVVVSVREDDYADYGPYQVWIDRVVRIDKHDALGFAIRIDNRLAKPLRLDPEAFLIRSGEYTFPVTIADVPLTIPGGETAYGYLLVVGTGKGGRNNLAADGRFRVIMQTLQSAEDFAESVQRAGNEADKGGSR
jgi:hypothetical protein